MRYVRYATINSLAFNTHEQDSGLCIKGKRNFSEKKEEEKFVDKLHEFVVIAFICRQARTGTHTHATNVLFLHNYILDNAYSNYLVVI